MSGLWANITKSHGNSCRRSQFTLGKFTGGEVMGIQGAIPVYLYW